MIKNLIVTILIMLMITSPTSQIEVRKKYVNSSSIPESIKYVDGTFYGRLYYDTKTMVRGGATGLIRY